MIAPAEQNIIRPEILAAKQAAVRNFKAPKVREQLQAQPRLFELFWFLQGMSMQPGGLEKYCQDFLAEFSGRIGTRSMSPVPKGGAVYPKKQRDAIIAEIPEQIWESSIDSDLLKFDFMWGTRCVPLDEPLPTREGEQKRLQFLSTLNYAAFHKLCGENASRSLATLLCRVCHEAQTALESPWYFHRLLDALVEAMDLHARRAQASLATTEVSLKIFDALEYSRAENALVRIEGDSRFGKTESVKTWCAARPGRARLVSVPCSNADADLYKAFADALGVEYTFRTSPRELKSKVEYIIHFSGLMWILDESHFLLPTRFHANTPPMRLNWVRTQIVDKKCPVVLVSTPQDYRKCVDKFVRATGHNIQQFLGRTMLNVTLPAELEEADLTAVAKIHFPDLDDDFLQAIVGTAMRAESYLMAVEALAKRVRYLARRDGHKTVTLADLKLAMSEIMPSTVAPARAAPALQCEAARLPEAPRPFAIRTRPARSVRPAALPLAAPSRSITPATETQPA